MPGVYRHIRLDKNEPFYIGVYSKGNEHRPYDKINRNPFWKKLVNKIKGEYSIEIIYECESYQKALDKEVEFIKLYGRRDQGSGTLTNLTDGGDGTKGRKPSKEEIIRRVATFNKVIKERGGLGTKGKKIEEIWSDKNRVKEHKNILKSKIGSLNSNYGNTWNVSSKEQVVMSKSKPICCEMNGEVIHFLGVMDCERELQNMGINAKNRSIRRALNNHNSYKGFTFKNSNLTPEKIVEIRGYVLQDNYTDYKGR